MFRLQLLLVLSSVLACYSQLCESGDSGCETSDETLSEVTSLLQKIKSTQVALAEEKPLLAGSAGGVGLGGQVNQLRGTGVVLHLHFDNNQWGNRNTLWYLEQTRLCHPDNFVACLFVTDWEGVSKPDLSKYGANVKLVDCPANKQVHLASTNEVWSAFYVHKCYAQSLKLVQGMSGVHGVLFLEDDTAVVRPWKALAVDLRNHGGIVLPGIQDKQHTNLLDNKTWPPHWKDQWFWDGDGLDPNPSRLLAALRRFRPEEQGRQGMTSLSVPVFKASADVLYVPLSQATVFRRLVDTFVDAGIFVEYAVGNIARGIDGQHAILGPSDSLSLKSLWHDNRKNPFHHISSIRDDPASPIAFVHPVKIGDPGPADGIGNKANLRALYADIFA